jgi:Uma2 family endonuclease
MVQSPSRPISLEEFLRRPETKPASEYLGGKIVQKPMPQGKHSTLQTELAIALNGALKPQKIARVFSELRCTFGGRSIVPDLSVFAWDRIPRDASGEIANTFLNPPDWTLEILSPDQSQTRVTKNILHCLNFGTQMGWLIDPDEKTVFVHQPMQPLAVFDNPDQVVPAPDFAKDLSLTLDSIFAWLLE